MENADKMPKHPSGPLTLDLETLSIIRSQYVSCERWALHAASTSGEMHDWNFLLTRSIGCTVPVPAGFESLSEPRRPQRKQNAADCLVLKSGEAPEGTKRRAISPILSQKSRQVWASVGCKVYAEYIIAECHFATLSSNGLSPPPPNLGIKSQTARTCPGASVSSTRRHTSPLAIISEHPSPEIRSPSALCLSPFPGSGLVSVRFPDRLAKAPNDGDIIMEPVMGPNSWYRRTTPAASSDVISPAIATTATVPASLRMLGHPTHAIRGLASDGGCNGNDNRSMKASASFGVRKRREKKLL